MGSFLSTGSAGIIAFSVVVVCSTYSTVVIVENSIASTVELDDSVDSVGLFTSTDSAGIVASSVVEECSRTFTVVIVEISDVVTVEDGSVGITGISTFSQVGIALQRPVLRLQVTYSNPFKTNPWSHFNRYQFGFTSHFPLTGGSRGLHLSTEIK